MDMGMPLAFDGDRADFTRMGSCADGVNLVYQPCAAPNVCEGG